MIDSKCIPNEPEEMVIEYTRMADQFYRWGFTLYWLKDDYHGGKPEPESTIIDGKKWFIKAQCFHTNPEPFFAGREGHIREVDHTGKRKRG